jgi:hypothetical protein
MNYNWQHLCVMQQSMKIKHEEGLCMLGSKGPHTQIKGEKRAELPGAALFTRTKRDSLPDWLLEQSCFHYPTLEVKG